MLPISPILITNADLQVFGFFTSITSLFLIYNLNVFLFTKVLLLTSVYSILGYCGYRMLYNIDSSESSKVFGIMTSSFVLFMVSALQFNQFAKIITLIFAYSVLMFCLFTNQITIQIKEPKNINYVLYNKTKNGFGAYWVAYRWYFQTFGKQIPSRVFNGTIPHDISKKNVLLIDLDLSCEQLSDLRSKAKSLVMINKTSNKNCMLQAWEYFNTSTPPSLVFWIDSPSSDLLTLTHLRLKKFNDMFDHPYYFQQVRGAIENKSNMMKCLKNKMYFSVENDTVVGYVNTGFWKDEFANMMMKTFEFVDYVVVWSSDGTNTICSYRTNKDDVDVRKFARVHGGDGVSQYKAGSRTFIFPQNTFTVNKNDKVIISEKEYDIKDTTFKNTIVELYKPTTQKSYSIFG